MLNRIIWTGVTIYLEEDYQCVFMTQKKKKSSDDKNVISYIFTKSAV